jgi:hypothetical protein
MRGETVTEVATKGTPTDDGTIRPFRIDLPQDAVDDMRRRIAATRWPKCPPSSSWEQPALFSSELRAAFKSLD